MFWLRRTLAILALSLGVVLVAAPFPDSIRGSSGTSVIRLDMGTAPVDSEEAQALVSGPVVELTAENLEATPELRQQLPRLWNTGGTLCISQEEWRGFRGLLKSEPSVGRVFSFRDSLQEITAIDLSDDDEICFSIERLATLANPDFVFLVRLDHETLAHYPQVLEAVRARRQAGLDGGPDGPPIAENEWNLFRQRELRAGQTGVQFVIDGALFWGVEEEIVDTWTRPSPWLRPTAIAVGLALVLIGSALLISVYRMRAKRPGIASQPLGIAVFGDMLILMAGLFISLGTVDAIWSAALGQPGLVPVLTGSEPGKLSGFGFASLLGIIFGLPIMTLAVSLITEQRVVIDDDAITSLGVAGRAVVPWLELETVRITGKGPGSLVELVGHNRTINISQASASCREQIKVALGRHAPADKQHMLQQLETEW